jgi:hypothetical protein
MSSTDHHESNNPDGAPATSRLLSYALFLCDPLREPPFTLELGYSDRSIRYINDCEHIPDAIEKLDEFCKTESITKSESFTLLYPIYLEAMGTDGEDTMHNIAWIIKEQADTYGWQFGRVGGYTEKTAEDFIS